jgi:hypothetical protein
MSVTPAELKADVETALADVQTLLTIAEDVPLPAQVKSVLATVQTVLTDAKVFLDA